MSSFYGQLRWQDFQRFFYNFKLSNNYFNTPFNDTPDAGEDTVSGHFSPYLQPNEDFATLNVNSANHWIKLAPSDSIGDTPITYSGFSIFHNKANTSNLKDFHCLEVTALPQGSEPTILRSGDVLKVLQIKFDEAGHFSEADLTPEYFQLAPQIIDVNGEDLYIGDDQKFHFSNTDKYIILDVGEGSKNLVFGHKTNFKENVDTKNFFFEGIKDESYEVVRQLQDGDYISSYNLVYDNAGHLITYEKVYYQLPMSKVAEDLQDITATVKEMKAQLEEVVEQVESHGTKIAEHAIAIDKHDLFLGSQSEMQKAIDKIVTGSAQGQEFNVGNSFSILVDYVKNDIAGRDIKGIVARLQVIEGKLGIQYT